MGEESKQDTEVNGLLSGDQLILSLIVPCLWGGGDKDDLLV